MSGYQLKDRALVIGSAIPRCTVQVSPLIENQCADWTIPIAAGEGMDSRLAPTTRVLGQFKNRTAIAIRSSEQSQTV